MSDTGPAKLPGIPTFTPSDKSLALWARAVTEWLQVRAGARGNPAEAAATQRDLSDLSDQLTAAIKVASTTGSTPEDIVKAFTASKAYKDLVTKIGAAPAADVVPKAVTDAINAAMNTLSSSTSKAIAQVQRTLQSGIDKAQGDADNASIVADKAANDANGLVAVVAGRDARVNFVLQQLVHAPVIVTDATSHAGGGSTVILSATITLPQDASTIIAYATFNQSWSAGFVNWRAKLKIDGTVVHDTGTVSSGSMQNVVTLTGAKAMTTAGAYVVALEWTGTSSGVSRDAAILTVH